MLVQKEEESHTVILNLKQEVTKLQRQLRENTNQKGNNSAASDRELAKLSVENEMLRKQIEEMNSRSSNISLSNANDTK